MSEEREIEAKTILAQDTYEKIKAAFPAKSDFIQTNYYFDTRNWDLRSASIGLRIRLFADHAEQTMKVPDLRPVQHKFHELIEISDQLDLADAVETVTDAKEGKAPVFLGNVGQYMQQHLKKAAGKLELITWSRTHRLLAQGPENCELTLDKTSYPDGFSDHELEIENTSPRTIARIQKQLEKRFSFVQTASSANQNKSTRALKHRK